MSCLATATLAWAVACALLAVLAFGSVATAQSDRKIWHIGMLWVGSEAGSARNFHEFRQMLRDRGYVEGQHIVFHQRFAQGQYDSLPGLATDLLQSHVDIVVTVGAPAAQAAKASITSIPVVMTAVGEDPVATGLVKSLTRPGANITGFVSLLPEIARKHLELLKDAVPGLKRVVVVWNPNNRGNIAQLTAVQHAGQSLRIRLEAIAVRSASDVEPTVSAISANGPQGVILITDNITFLTGRRLMSAAATSRMPLITGSRDLVYSGALMSYGPSIQEMIERTAAFVERILKGAKPAELPVEQPSRFELVINLKTAKALGLTIPPSLLARADQVIE
jgi:putative tryptophan/tyrosine transport system substrate-binding protein